MNNADVEEELSNDRHKETAGRMKVTNFSETIFKGAQVVSWVDGNHLAGYSNILSSSSRGDHNNYHPDEVLGDAGSRDTAPAHSLDLVT